MRAQWPQGTGVGILEFQEFLMRPILLVVMLLSGLGAVAHAELIELEGRIRSIDQESRFIAIARKTPKGEKILELEVAKNAGDISGFKDGDAINFTYNPDVDIISEIEKVGAGSIREINAKSPVFAVAFHPDGKRFAFVNSKCLVRLMSTQEGNNGGVTMLHVPLKELKHTFLPAVTISPTGTLLASAANDGSVRIWDISGKYPKEWEPISKNTGIVTPIHFSPDGKLLATAERASGITRLFDVSGSKAKPAGVLAPGDGEVWSLAFSPDAKTLVTGMWFSEMVPKHGALVAWDLTKTPARRAVVIPTTGLPRSITTLPDGKSLVFADQGLVRRVALADGKDLGVLDCFPSDSTIVSIAIHPDGKHIAVGGYVKEVKILEIATGKEVAQLSEDFKGVESLAFSPDGKSLLIGSKDSKVRIWKPAFNGE